MFCKNCGHQVPDGDKFCFYCGQSLVAPVEQPAPASTPTPQVTAEATPDPVSFHVPAPAAPESQPVTYAVPVPPAQTAKPKKKGKGCLVTLIVVLALLLALVIAATCILLPKFLNSKNDDGTTATTTLTTSATKPVSAPATEPVPAPELSIVPAELVYEMTDEDVDEFYALLEQCEKVALEGEDDETVMEVSDELDAQYEYMDAQYTIAYVLYYCDLKNEDASQLYLDCTDIVTQAYNDYMEMAKRLYDAEFPAKEAFFEEWTEQDMAMLKAYTPEVMALQQRNSEIEVAYQDMQDSNTMYEDMVPLYVEMVQNNNRIAQIYGYDNYYTYAYEMEYDRDYGSEEIAQMRSYVSTYLVDAAENTLNRFSASMESLSMVDQMTLSAFLLSSYDPTFKDEAAEYFAILPDQPREDMLDMFNGNILMMDTANNAREGAFTANIGTDRAICFFGPGYSSVLTVMHEVGHYYGSKHTYLPDIPLDLAETQSQGNEWLFMAYMNGKMSDKLYNAIVDYKTYNDLATILICTIVDEFEERVYTHPDVASLTSDDLDAIMAEVCENYGGISYLNTNVTSIQEYWRMVVIEQPVYYISYGVSAIAAMNLYTEAMDDFNNAVEIYRGLIEDVDLESGFLGNLEIAGLNGPFDEKVYKALTRN